MSQFWNAHWAEDAYKPGLLGNWQVPNWHPEWPCIRHCVATTFLADKSGRLLPDKPRTKRSPWGDFKGTWDLPLKIDRKLAQKLSAPPEYKLAAWKAHKLHYEGLCGFAATKPKTFKTNPEKQTKRRKSPVRIAEITRKPNVPSKEVDDKIEGKKNEAIGINKKGKSSATRKATDDTNRSRNVNQPKRVSEDRSKVTKDEEKAAIEKAEYEEEKTAIEKPEYEEEQTVTEEPEYEGERTVTKEPEYKKDVTVTQEPPVAKRHRERRRKAERTECFCENEFDSNPPAEIVPKATRKICTIHQSLRV